MPKILEKNDVLQAHSIVTCPGKSSKFPQNISSPGRVTKFTGTSVANLAILSLDLESF